MISRIRSKYANILWTNIYFGDRSGPFQFDYEAYDGSLPPLISNPYTFTQVASFIFLDAPVGTGFSYLETDRGYYIKDDIDSADVNYQFLQKV